MHKKFYHGTTKKMIVAFSTVFDGISIDLDNGKEITVPLHYAQAEKFLQKINKYSDLEDTIKPIAMPVMGFEWVSMNYEPERHTNTMNKMQDRKLQNERKYMYNRTPVAWNFELYVAVQRLNDGLKIIEQIIPFFTPHLNLRVRGVEEIDEPDNVQLILTSFSHDINYADGMDEIRNIVFQFSFTLKGYLYQDVKKHKTIKDTIINIEKMTDTDFEEKFMQIAVNADENNDIKEVIKE